MFDMNKTERCVKIAEFLLDGDSLTIGEMADKLGVPYGYVWRDVDSLGRILPLAKGDDGKIVLVRVNSGGNLREI